MSFLESQQKQNTAVSLYATINLESFIRHSQTPLPQDPLFKPRLVLGTMGSLGEEQSASLDVSLLTKAKALGMTPGAQEPRSVSSHLNLVHHTAAQSVKCHLGFRGWHEPLCWGRQQWVRDPFMTCGTSLTLRAALWGPHSLRGHRILSQDTAAGLTLHPPSTPIPPAPDSHAPSSASQRTTYCVRTPGQVLSCDAVHSTDTESPVWFLTDTWRGVPALEAV